MFNMFKSLILSFKWVFFLIKFKIYKKWMFETIEGGINLKNHLISLGILGIKVGQYLYTCADVIFINDDVKSILSYFLTDNVIHPFEYTMKILKEDTNNFIQNIERVEVNVIGSGSIAQVHVCYLKNKGNTKYILKIAHPSVNELENEVNILQNILSKLSYFIDINIDWQAFCNNMLQQVDLNNEAYNINVFYEMYKNYDKIETPRLIYSNKHYIIMTYCEGVHLDNIDKNSEQYNIATQLVTSSVLYSLNTNTLYHCDLHPGNILVKPNGYISIIDFGICNSNNDKLDEMLYNYRFFRFYLDIDSVNKLLNYIIIQKDIEIDYTNLILNLVIFLKKIKKTKMSNVDIFQYLLKFCSINKLALKGNTLFIISQLRLLEYYNTTDVYDGSIYLKTLSFMRKEYFFMNIMKDNIEKFYKLEYMNEKYDVIKQKYS